MTPEIWADSSPTEGVVYVSGAVERPGTYNLPVQAPLRLERLILASGGPVQGPGNLFVTVARAFPDGSVRHITVPYAELSRESNAPQVFLKAGDFVIIQHIS
jgi:protein involved in polysaccharide export with SLBB domain